MLINIPREGNGLAVELISRNLEGRSLIPRLSSRRWSPISIEHTELLRSTPSLGLCCVWLVTIMALHVHCGVDQLSLLPTSGDDKWVAAKHCERAKRSRISNTHRLQWSLQFRYINSQSLLFTFYQYTILKDTYVIWKDLLLNRTASWVEGDIAGESSASWFVRSRQYSSWKKFRNTR